MFYVQLTKATTSMLAAWLSSKGEVPSRGGRKADMLKQVMAMAARAKLQDPAHVLAAFDHEP